MPKFPKTFFVCQHCGYKTPKWIGRCSECGSWNSMVEEKESEPGKNLYASVSMGEPESINCISLSPEKRIETGISEFDRTLGGGIIAGSIVLIGGDPGIGKSTLLLQVFDNLSQKGFKTLYLSGEESAQQIKMRGERLSINSDNLYILSGTRIEDLFEKIDALKPRLLAVDSIQTVYTDSISSPPGSVSQLKEAASRLMSFAKESGTPVFLIGHVTKEGMIAGPKVLEHLVDTVLYFEGDKGHLFRILRSVKNRYGPTNEIGVFEMKDAGLVGVDSPSRIFLQERPGHVSGSVVISCLEGTRPVLVEIQALIGRSPFGMPRRTSVGVEQNRISLLVAVLGKRLGMELGDQDIFVNVVGGLKVDEPAADIGIISAMMSSFLDKPLNQSTVLFGEVGLAGEIRGVSRPELRIKEAKKLGFTKCFLPKSNLETITEIPGMELTGVGSIIELYESLF